ncbi:heavy metal translocating P-type ATPase [Brumimicrobium salinarum]|uniref:Heavy metal translocating P-type ATPase n=1 Tax=Brumimicrobium salinarum TaxID=2058658 RepID=A0A2I0QZM2_9FLAO|nr:heavy metal translocating P-type ATPase metal-binding domain-containing protein [Brumimicrobium salinarum]PKR79776.1 heavy metal translocating P-type ATPase [Brumimicrobium salinarum]
MGCYHCGDKVIGSPISKDGKDFCCSGCLTVYEILNDNGLDKFYEFNEQSGIKPETEGNAKYTALDVPEIFNDFIEFKNDDIYIVTFFLPAIHCSSCIYLLENLKKLNTDILESESNFTARTLTLTVKKDRKLSDVATLLESIGYKPELRRGKENKSAYDKKLLMQLGVAGFAFGNVMLWSFPEYLGLDDMFEDFRNFSAYLALAAAIPVLLYSASGYFISAYTAIKTKQLNLDIPVALGILVLFIKSSSSILMQEGASYMDSFTGFVFFLLIGKWFQSKTYRNMSFDNDPKAYFPLGVHRKNKITGEEEVVQIEAIEKDDILKIFNEEIIPCDAELINEKAVIDTSFITGEANLATLKKGDKIYAGSKLIGSATEVKSLSTTNRSKFASIWNKSAKTTKSIVQNRENLLSKYFLIIVSIVSAAAAITWAFIDPSRILEIVTAILVVACPCALAISFPFVYGNALRKLGRSGLYFRNSHEIQKLNKINHIVFDKTGTLTKDRIEGVIYEGEELSPQLIAQIYALTRQSTHPYSKSITKHLEEGVEQIDAITDYKEVSGQGVQAITSTGDSIKLGNARFTNASKKYEESGSYISINDQVLGFFKFQSQLREGIIEEINRLQKQYKITLLSGDQATDEVLFEGLNKPIDMHFNLSPTDKKQHIIDFNNAGDVVAFIGDGLNDSEALAEAELGISVSEDEFRFTPKCDAIIESDKIKNLKGFFKFGLHAKKVLRTCMYFSLVYNTFGITFAFLGYVTPLFAAILMPISSISIVLLSTFLIQPYRIE